MPNNAINPASTDSFIRGGQLAFKCPTCPSAVFIGLSTIDPVIGVNVVCPGCGNTAHVPGSYRTRPNVAGLSITGGVEVSIAEYVDWFLSHPLVVTLKKAGQVDLLCDYGLWGFCPKCNYQYTSTVLAYNLPFLQMAHDADGFVLRTSTSNSYTETTALQSGHCPSCGHKSLIVIIADIPDYVRTAIASIRKKKR